MKRFTLRMVSLCAGIVLTLGLSYSVARAQCSDLVIGQGWSCSLDNQCNGWCYYTCECHGISQQQCDQRLADAGFEDVPEGGPQC
jgi:hypothetical protein